MGISSMNYLRNRIVILLALMALLAGPLAAQTQSAPAKNKNKNDAPKPDGLAAYLQHVSAKPPVIAAPTAGSLWTDMGRLANMVTDYKASRVGDLVTISVAQNLSATTTGDVSTNRSFTASSGIAWALYPFL